MKYTPIVIEKKEKSEILFLPFPENEYGLAVGSMFYLMALKGILLSFFCQTLNDFSCSISE